MTPQLPEEEQGRSWREEAEQLAMLFHATYERLAPQFGYKTREESAKPWLEVPEQNRELMIAVASEILSWHEEGIKDAYRQGQIDALEAIKLKSEFMFDQPDEDAADIDCVIVGDINDELTRLRSEGEADAA